MGEILYANAIHIRAQAKIDAARITQKSGNEKRGAQAELQRDSASLGNRRAMDAAGDQIGAITENISRNLDAATFGTFESRIQAAEELGASVASAAAAGIGGSSVESYNATLRLNQAMKEEQQGRAVHSDNIAASASRGDTLVNAVGGLDNNVYDADQDFTQYVDHHKMGLFQRISTLGTAAVAGYFGGPQAASAVISLGESGQEAANGDFAASSSSLTSAIQNGIGGFKAYRAGANAEHPTGQAWGSSQAILNSLKLK